MTTDSGSRLHTAVDNLLEMISDTSQQLQEAQRTQRELVQALTQRGEEKEVLESRCEDLESRLKAEIEAKEYLGMELNKAEGLYCNSLEIGNVCALHIVRERPVRVGDYVEHVFRTATRLCQ